MAPRVLWVWPRVDAAPPLVPAWLVPARQLPYCPWHTSQRAEPASVSAESAAVFHCRLQLPSSLWQPAAAVSPVPVQVLLLGVVSA